MKSDTDWKILEQSGNPLLTVQVIEKHILSQTEDIHPFASVYKQEKTRYTFHHNYITSNHWCNNFNSWSEVDNAIKVTRQQKVLIEHVTQKNTVSLLKAYQEMKKL